MSRQPFSAAKVQQICRTRSWGRKWTGSDIPASILEAAELFSERMRATRAMKQLWEERVEFMKFERGWTGENDDARSESSDSSIEIPILDLALVEGVTLDGPTQEEGSEQKENVEQLDPKAPALDGSVGDRLRAVEAFYSDGLPHLQSLVMVLLKTILANVTSLITQANGQNGVQSSFHFQDAQNGSAARTEGNGGGNGLNFEASHVSTGGA